MQAYLFGQVIFRITLPNILNTVQLGAIQTGF